MTFVQLSGLDAGFLSLETPRSPMLVGGVSILSAGSGAGRLTVERLREVLRPRLTAAVALRRRLTGVPFDLTRPYWVELDAAAVDLEAHVERTELPEPGGWHELSALMAWELSRPVDRGRPLWQLTFVEGLKLPGHPPDTVALIGKVHHAAIDGVSGAEILSVLFDGPHHAGAAVPKIVATVTAAGAAEGSAAPGGFPPPPGVLDLLARTGRDLAAVPVTATAVVGRSLFGVAAGAWQRLRSDAAPPLPFTAPKTVLNRPLGGKLEWAPASFPLSRVKALKEAWGASVNDVVLAICAGALRGWLADRDALPAEPLVAMVPVSVRGDDERNRGGNLVSAMLVPLATDEAGPGERLQRIRDAARSSKVAHQALGARTLTQSADLLPFALSGLAAQLYTRWHLSERHRPLFNLVITNVPGPARPLSIAGAPLLAHVGAAPLFDGLGLILTVMSYAGTVTVGVTADRAVMPDAEDFAARIESSLADLEVAVPPSLAG
jgi:diacylglycerol O-acyltransferase